MWPAERKYVSYLCLTEIETLNCWNKTQLFRQQTVYFPHLCFLSVSKGMRNPHKRSVTARERITRLNLFIFNKNNISFTKTILAFFSLRNTNYFNFESFLTSDRNFGDFKMMLIRDAFAAIIRIASKLINIFLSFQ